MDRKDKRDAGLLREPRRTKRCKPVMGMDKVASIGRKRCKAGIIFKHRRKKRDAWKERKMGGIGKP